MKIKAGYRIEVVTWENDGCNSATKAIEGLSKEEVVEIVKYLKLFEKSGWEGGLGNIYDPDESFIEKYKTTLQNLYNENKAMWDTYFDAEEGEVEDFSEWVDDILGCDTGILTGGEFFTRKVERFSVTYTPYEIMLEDVTDQFN